MKPKFNMSEPPYNSTFSPPCHSCGSEDNWLPGKDGEQCHCGWPNKEENPTDSFGNSALGQYLGCASVILAILLGISLILWICRN